ncbi:DUF1778 domain-containing protein [Variovorax sp. J31P207]|uniref:type II toxin-antitoxin system TacA family antitoxin n=1 Tax=Variovorax sp. J31P207 TaxID=3053510 RepID=UPI0025791EFE|nr:DUF1778 domain-containing protein [Variovorax sp. J31P207]MDM0067191.1 DUF1778 domain-containing protein [Variovorax sp. J31P207]
MSTTATRTISLRTPPAQRELIDRAARLAGKSRTDFMLEAASEKAQQVLLDRTLFEVPPDKFEAFEALMAAPLSNNGAIQRLLATRAPWDK